MAPSPPQLGEVVRIRATYTQEFFEGLGQRSFPQPYLAEVAALPVELAKLVLEQATIAPPAGEDATARHARERQLKRYGFLLEHVHRVAEFLESSEVLAIPASIAVFLSETVQRLIPDGKLVLRADTEFNYSFDPLAESINEPLEASGLGVSLPTPLGLFKFPAACRDDSLLHAILAHEVGHFLDQFHGLSQAVFDRAGDAVLRTVESELHSALNSNDAQVDAALQLLFEWVGELVSDLSGVHLLGPAFALAMREFFEFENDPTQGESHPPTLMRLDLIHMELQHLKWIEQVMEPRGIWPDVPALAPPVILTGSSSEERIIEAVHQQVMKYLDACREIVRELFHGQSFSGSAFTPVESALADLLTNHLPPAESVRSDGSSIGYSPECIINACWIFWATGADGWKAAGYSDYDKRALLGRLMLKALEITRIRTRLG
jgi:hypothetical protein